MDLLQLEFLWKLAEYMSRKFNFNFGRAKFKVIEDSIWYKHGELVVKKAPLKIYYILHLPKDQRKLMCVKTTRKNLGQN